MGDEQHRLVGYFSRLVSGLVACAVVAVTLHTDVAAVAMLAAVMLVVVAMSCLLLRRAI
ncbi:MAG TPA: hypothetical protein VJ741_17895 [Solirubrobacteraceae bacterium]|nr:hypothetical protein [Solirubrobacteraceae bacterium]